MKARKAAAVENLKTSEQIVLERLLNVARVMRRGNDSEIAAAAVKYETMFQEQLERGNE